MFTYPVLMAADILLYDADFVPVGEDQRQHIELTRDLAQRLNSQRGDVVKVPAPLISTVGARVMGLDTPDEKMSKSIAVDRPGHAVLLLDPPDVVRRKIARATTDTEPAVHKPLGAGVANLLEIYAALLEISRGCRARGVRRQAIQRAQGSGRRCDHRRARPRFRRATPSFAPMTTALRRVLAESAARVPSVADATLLSACRRRSACADRYAIAASISSSIAWISGLAKWIARGLEKVDEARGEPGLGVHGMQRAVDVGGGHLVVGVEHDPSAVGL